MTRTLLKPVGYHVGRISRNVVDTVKKPTRIFNHVGSTVANLVEGVSDGWTDAREQQVQQDIRIAEKRAQRKEVINAMSQAMSFMARGKCQQPEG